MEFSRYWPKHTGVNCEPRPKCSFEQGYAATSIDAIIERINGCFTAWRTRIRQNHIRPDVLC